MIIQLSGDNGTSATMYPLIDTEDPDDELAMRTPETAPSTRCSA
jgi:hypothetical protein